MIYVKTTNTKDLVLARWEHFCRTECLQGKPITATEIREWLDESERVGKE